MTFDPSRLLYELPAGDDVFRAEVPTGLASKADLLVALEEVLKLPDYFGQNWDALDECLRDLSWIDARSVVLQHRDVPGLSEGELSTYLEILASSVADWAPDEDHELKVVFPPCAQEVIERLSGS